MKLITGLHHVSAITGQAQKDLDFYAGVLGMRLVKRTVNYDNPDVYHLYFGDQTGTAGTLMTTFPYGETLEKGRHGKGKLNTTAFSLALEGMDFWLERLTAKGIPYKHPQERSGDEVFVYLEDFNGLGIELVFSDSDTRKGRSNHEVPAPLAIKGLHHVEIWTESYERSAALLMQQMDHMLIQETSARVRLGVIDRPGCYVDLLSVPPSMQGLMGRGMVHHVAFGTPDGETLSELMQRLEAAGYDHTGIRDRNYFQSVYFNEPSGVVFEIATLRPGFQKDESENQLGHALMLPAQLEEQRAAIASKLPALKEV